MVVRRGFTVSGKCFSHTWWDCVQVSTLWLHGVEDFYFFPVTITRTRPSHHLPMVQGIKQNTTVLYKGPQTFWDGFRQCMFFHQRSEFYQIDLVTIFLFFPYSVSIFFSSFSRTLLDLPYYLFWLNEMRTSLWKCQRSQQAMFQPRQALVAGAWSK